MAVNGINSINVVSPAFGSMTKVQESTDKSLNFADMLNDALNKVNDLQMQSNEITDAFIAGKSDNLHQVMIASEKADLALQFTMQIRTKVLDAYNEIMRIQI